MKPQEPWNEEEREALVALRREAQPAGDLEGRIVDRLRREGRVGGRAARWWWLPGRPAPRLGWASVAAAVALATFLAGVTVGRATEGRATVEPRATADDLAAPHAAPHDDAASASARVQQTGSAYVTALDALGRLASTGSPQEVAEGREAALAALYAAASQLVRLDPDDPVAARLLQSLERAGATGETRPGDPRTQRQIVWF